MFEDSAAAVFWAACLAQAIGLVVLAVARSGQPCPECKWILGAFFLMMAVIGGMAVAAFQVGSGAWASCGATLAIMAVGATLDFPEAAVDLQIIDD
jgi:hypothetical protein